MTATLELHVNQILKTYKQEVFCFTNKSALQRTCKFLEEGIKQLNDMVRNHEFESVGTEVYYFKELKPKVVQEYVFLELVKSVNDLDDMVLWYKIAAFKKRKNEAKFFFEQHHVFYKYMLQKETDMDDLYFRKLETTRNFYGIDALNRDHRSSCSHGFLYAQLMAYEKFFHYCNQQLLGLKENEQMVYEPLTGFKIKWNAKKVDAIELIYALYYSGAVNVENGTIQELAQQFEKVFKVDVTQQLYRDYMDIKRRKIDTTRFLTKLAQQLKNKIEEQYQ